MATSAAILDRASSTEAKSNLGLCGSKHIARIGVPHKRRGLVWDQCWPFQLDINVEYQDWILVGVTVVLLLIFTLPCVCGRVKSNSCARSFSKWVYTRLHVFFWTATYLNLFILMFTIWILPDWNMHEYLVWLMYFVAWVLERLQKLIISGAIICVFYVVLMYRQRVALAAGLEYVTFLHCNWRDCLGLQTKQRPVEVFIWKIEGLVSGTRKILKPNDVFVECHMGNNEPVRTRVHNNAGSSSIIKESFQLNLDESASGTLMTILVMDQALLQSSELARLILSTREVCGIEDQTGKRRVNFGYSEDCFVPLSLSPSGRIWLAISPVEEAFDEERNPLVDEDALVTC